MVLNKAERETPTMERITRWLHAEGRSHRTMIVDIHDPEVYAKLLAFAPDLILTFPFTAAPLSRPFLVLKRVLDCRIVCLRAEGVIDFRSEQHVRWFAGMDSYPSTFVDHELAWGSRSAEVLADVLVRQGKLSDPRRVHHFGHPGLEHHFEGDPGEDPALGAELLARLRSAGKDKVVFFITGFHLAEYGRQELIGAGDIVRKDDPDYDARLEEACRGAERARRFRARWAETVLRCAERRPDALFVVKAHPIERIFTEDLGHPDPYATLRGRPNIVHLYRNVPVAALLAHAGLFLHYGSTCAVETHLLGVPSVFVGSRDIYGNPDDTTAYDYGDLGWPSTWRADLEELPDLVDRHLDASLAVGDTAGDMGAVMETLFSIRKEHVDRTEPYRPSKAIAEFLESVAGEAPQAVADNDPHLRVALAEWAGPFIDFCAKRASGSTLGSRAALTQVSRLARLAGSPALEVERMLVDSLDGIRRSLPVSPGGKACLRTLEDFVGRTDDVVEAIALLASEPGTAALVEGLTALVAEEDPEAAVGLPTVAPDASIPSRVAMRAPRRHPPMALELSLNRGRRLAEAGDPLAALDEFVQAAEDHPLEAQAAYAQAWEVLHSGGAPTGVLARAFHFELELAPSRRVLAVGDGSGAASPDWTQATYTQVVEGRLGAADSPKSSRYDLVVCGAGLEEVSDPVEVCKALTRLAPCGILDLPGPERRPGTRWILAVEAGVLVFQERPKERLDRADLQRRLLEAASGQAATMSERALAAFRLLEGEPWNLRWAWEGVLDLEVRCVGGMPPARWRLRG
jgi:hypothetical protein